MKNFDIKFGPLDKMPGSFNPSGGLKKPMNMIEGPVYPDIRKGPPRFLNAGKHWQVDSGRVMVDSGVDNFETFYGYAVNVQSRDYNKTVYGQSSHKDVVNQAFRPPLRDPYLDERPLSRVPVTINAIIPRGNPGSSSDTGGTVGYQARNNVPPDYALSKMIVDDEGLLKTSSDAGHVFSFRAIEDQVLPDLETKISVSDIAGINNQVQSPFFVQQRMDLELAEKQPMVSVGAGTKGPNVFQISGAPKFRESRHTPTSLASGMASTATFFESSDPRFIKENIRRQTIASSAGTSSSFTDNVVSPGSVLEGQIVDYKTFQNSAGFESSFGVNPHDHSIVKGQIINRTDASGTAGVNVNPIALPQADVELYAKLADPLQVVGSAGVNVNPIVAPHTDSELYNSNITNRIGASGTAGVNTRSIVTPDADRELYSHGIVAPLELTGTAGVNTRGMGVMDVPVIGHITEDRSVSMHSTPTYRSIGSSDIPFEQYSGLVDDKLRTAASAGNYYGEGPLPLQQVDYDLEEKYSFKPEVMNPAPLDLHVDNSSNAHADFTYIDRHHIPAQATPSSRFTKDNGKKKYHFRKKIQPVRGSIPLSGQNALPYKGIGVTENMMRLAIK